MKIRRIQLITIVFLMFFFSLSARPFQESKELKIYQAENEIVIDGKLDDWSAIQEIPVNLAPNGKKIEPSADIAVTVKFTFDSKKFYAAIKVIDDKIEFPEGSWRFGDGLYLTFFDPYLGNESDRFYSYGISLYKKEPTGGLINWDGVYLPGISVEDIDAEIIPKTSENSIIYEIAFPWKFIVPFKPFIHKKWGINLIYVDLDEEKREILQLFPDSNYDSEQSKKRKGGIFDFVVHKPAKHEFQVSLNASHFYHDTERIVTCMINSPTENSDWEFRYDLSSAFDYSSSIKKIDLKKGMNVLKFPIKAEIQRSGSYDLSVGILDDQSVLKFRDDLNYFMINREEWDELNLSLIKAEKSDFFQKDQKFRQSLPSLGIRLEWIGQFMKESHPFADYRSANEWYQEARTFSDNVSEGKPALLPPGNTARLAHRSKIDDTLQPYSVYIPTNYDGETPLPLFVTLHGSEVDERSYIQMMSGMLGFVIMRARWGNFIILAPKARGLSDWYLGDSGKDVIECIDHLKELYNIDEKNIVLDGFSMGGYGVWRVGLLNPKLFKALIIRSGAILPPPDLKGENIIDLLDKAKGLNIFIVHGDEDKAVSVENARKVVQKLVKLGIEHEYIEVKGTSHIGYKKWPNIFKWLKKIVGDAGKIKFKKKDKDKSSKRDKDK